MAQGLPKGISMKSEFIQPRFEGSRFAEHTLPLDVARDLAAYETLIVELAKRLYLKDNPERQRVPKGFGSEFHLHIERLDDGSARPQLAIVTAGELALGSGGFNTYFERARDLVTECIAASADSLPIDFPRDLLGHFNQVGRSLQQDESMEIPGSGGVTATLTPDRRKQLVLAADTVYEKEIEISGTIGEIDWEKKSFRLRLLDGTKVENIPLPDSFHADARKYGGRHRHLVTLRVVGAFDSWDRMQKVIAVNTPIDVQEDFRLAARFDELKTLKDGWHDGQGVAPQPDILDVIAAKLIGHFPEKLPLPAIVPTPEGNLLFEWDAPGDASIDLDLSESKVYFHAFGPDQKDIEREFDLSTSEGWQLVFEALTQFLGNAQS